MKRRRVGTFSLGILMVIIGVMILFGGLKGISGVQMMLKFWPVILISIGIEVLYFVYRYKNEEVKLKYDLLSVFIFITLIMISSGVFIFNEFMDNEVSNVLMEDIKSRAHSDIVIKEFEFSKKNIHRIEINDNSNITLRESSDDNVRIKASMVIRARSEEIIEEYKNDIIDIEEQNGVLLISDFNEENIEKLVEVGGVTTTYEMFIPEGIKIDIDNFYGKVDIRNLKNDLNLYLNRTNLDCYNVQGKMVLKGDYADIDLEKIQGDIKVDVSGEQLSFKDISGKLSGNMKGYGIEIEGLKGECDINLQNGHADILFKEIIEHNIKIGGNDCSIELDLPKNQEGKFYFETNKDISIRNDSVIKKDDIKSVNDDEYVESKVVEKTLGEGPEIEVNGKQLYITIK